MKKNIVLIISSMLLTALFISGCGGGGSSSSSDTQTAVDLININGSVNDAPVAFAEVRLILFSNGDELVNLTADANGKWSHVLDKNKLSADSFIMIYATNPVNGAIIRSAIDTDEVLAETDVYEADETTVSHYTEAAIILAEVDGGLDQEKYDAIKSLIKVENSEPVATGSQEVDELADTIQTSFDNNESSNDELMLEAYTHLVKNIVAEAVPDEFGSVALKLPTPYNEEISVDVNLSTGGSVTRVDDIVSFDLTPQERQEDLNITVSVELNSKTLTETVTLYALDNSEGHYIYEAVAPSSEPTASKISTMINGRYYTLIPYSFASVDESNANINSIDLNGILRGRAFETLKIADNYASTKTLIRAYEGKTTFDGTTLVGNTEIVALASNQVDVGNIEVTRVDDFRPIQPIDTNIEMPPVAPGF